MDSIGRGVACAAAYIDPVGGYQSPVAQHPTAECESANGVEQTMLIDCRTQSPHGPDPYNWIVEYQSVPFLHEHVFHNDNSLFSYALTTRDVAFVTREWGETNDCSD
jgi:hypothetical protein